MVGRILRTLLACACIVLVLVVAAFAWGRLRGPNAAQAAALDLLHQNLRPDTGQNAWPTLWLAGYDVPADKVAATYAKDVQRLKQLAASHHSQTAADKALISFTSSAEGVFPKLAPLDAASRNLLCSGDNPSCLAHVRQHAATIPAVLATRQARLNRFRSLRHASMAWDTTPPTLFTPIPPIAHPQSLWLTAAALKFVNGQHAQAVASVCDNARMVRRLHAHTNNLVASMLTIRWMESSERLLAQMLSQLPADTRLPASCQQAFAPVTRADVTLCPSMQRAFNGLHWLSKKLAADNKSWWLWLTLDRDKGTSAMIAPSYAWACTPAVQKRMLTDLKLDPAKVPATDYDLFNTVSNYMGTIWARVARPDFTKYMARNEDYAGGLRLMAWLLHQRGKLQTTEQWQQALAKALPQLRQSGARSIRLDTDKQQLHMSFYESHGGTDTLVLPLPATAVAETPTAAL